MSVAEIEATLVAQTGTEIISTDDLQHSYAQERAGRFWLFTGPRYVAFPALVCRTVLRRNGEVGIQSEIICADSREDCDQFVRDNQASIDRLLARQ